MSLTVRLILFTYGSASLWIAGRIAGLVSTTGNLRMSFAKTPAPLISLTFRASGPDTPLP
jgi:hypothetical protein